jgi:hypothetical protein
MDVNPLQELPRRDIHKLEGIVALDNVLRLQGLDRTERSAD